MKDGGGVTVELHSGSCDLDANLRRGVNRGVNGIARYSDEAYKVRPRCGRNIRPYVPFVPDEVPPRKGRNKLRWYRGISALFPSHGGEAVFVWSEQPP